MGDDFEEALNKIDEKDEKTLDKEAIQKQIGLYKWDDRMSFKRYLSKASCYVSDIESFVFGGFSSRFWLLRKHINSMDTVKIGDLPFFCWECLTITTKEGKDINIVIKDQKEMTKLIEFLIVSL